MRCSNRPRFLADQMLGKLARWLRIFGFDTAYSNKLDDAQLLRMAKEEERILLSRDTQLLKTRPIIRNEVQAIYLRSGNLKEQLSEVLERFTLDEVCLNTPRCPLCNSETSNVDKGNVRGKVPSYVYKTHEIFTYCPQCETYYWKGTHWKRIEENIRCYRD